MSMVTSELSNTTPAGVHYTIRNTRKLADSGSHQSPCKLVEVFIHVAFEFITIPCLSCSQFNDSKHYYDHFQAKITASISRANSLASSAAIIAGDVLDYAVQPANQHRRKHVVAVMFQTIEVVDDDESIGAKRKRDTEHECVICMEEIGAVGESISLRCEHVFHRKCLFQWMDKGHGCPLCRSKLPFRLN